MVDKPKGFDCFIYLQKFDWKVATENRVVFFFIRTTFFMTEWSVYKRREIKTKELSLKHWLLLLAEDDQTNKQNNTNKRDEEAKKNGENLQSTYLLGFT